MITGEIRVPRGVAHDAQCATDASALSDARKTAARRGDRDGAGFAEGVEMSACLSSSSCIAPAFTLPRFATDRDLVRAMIDDDRAAWAAFHARYDRIVSRCITKVTRSFPYVSEADVQDIRSAFYLSLVEADKRRLRGFDPSRGNRFSTWIGLLAIHAARDRLRAIRRDPPRVALSEAFEVECEDPGPFEIASLEEHARLAAASLQDLTDRDRLFSELYFGGVPPTAIAEQLDIDVHTVYSKKHKLTLRLRAIFGQSSSSALRGRGRPRASRR
jgi:RNA polymerase sigma-70 factor (ECF subfamily)